MNKPISIQFTRFSHRNRSPAIFIPDGQVSDVRRAVTLVNNAHTTMGMKTKDWSLESIAETFNSGGRGQRMGEGSLNDIVNLYRFLIPTDKPTSVVHVLTEAGYTEYDEDDILKEVQAMMTDHPSDLILAALLISSPVHGPVGGHVELRLVNGSRMLLNVAKKVPNLRDNVVRAYLNGEELRGGRCLDCGATVGLTCRCSPTEEDVLPISWLQN